jgi:hypothetical protein
MAKKFYRAILSWLIIIICSCSTRQGSNSNPSTGNPSSNTSINPPGNTLKGWELNEANTGLAGVGIDKNTLPLCKLQPDPWSHFIILPAGSVIREMRIESPLDLSAGNITIERCWIRPLTAGLGSPIIQAYSPNLKNVIKDSEVDGTGIIDDSVIGYSFAIDGVADVEGCSIHDTGSGIAIYGDKAVNIENNYIYHLRNGYVDRVGMGWSHTDGYTTRGYNGPLLSVRNNRIVADTRYCTGAFFLQTTDGSHIDNILIQGNLFEAGSGLVMEIKFGGSYGNNKQVINNRFLGGRGYTQNFDTPLEPPIWDVWSDNYVYDPTAPDARGQVMDNRF